MYSRKSGFTLVEVMLASVIGAFIALVAVGTLKAVSRSAEMVDGYIETAAEVRFATKSIAADLMNLYRDGDLKNNKLIGEVEQSPYGLVSSLTFNTVGRIKARQGQQEGDVYEVQYYLARSEEKTALMRRLWPNPNTKTQPGGILSVIAEDVNAFEIRFFDGMEWQQLWPEEMERLPELVEVTIAANRKNGTGIISESYVVNFPRFITARNQNTEPGEQQDRRASAINSLSQGE